MVRFHTKMSVAPQDGSWRIKLLCGELLGGSPCISVSLLYCTRFLDDRHNLPTILSMLYHLRVALLNIILVTA